MTLRGRTDSNGNITFYFGRFNPDNTPIGIDNIEITGTVQDNIVDPNDSESGICYSYDTIVVYADAVKQQPPGIGAVILHIGTYLEAI